MRRPPRGVRFRQLSCPPFCRLPNARSILPRRQGETSLSKAVDCHPLITCRRPRQKKMRPERKGRLGPRAISPTPAPRRSEPTTAARSNPAQTAANVAEGERDGEQETGISLAYQPDRPQRHILMYTMWRVMFRYFGAYVVQSDTTKQ